MKPLAAILSLLLAPACTVAKGNRTTGEYSYASVGGNATNYRQTPDGMAGDINNSDAFRELNKTARFTTGAVQLGSTARSGINAVQSVKNTSTAASVSKATEATKQATIAAEQEAARRAAEAAAKELILPPVPAL